MLPNGQRGDTVRRHTISDLFPYQEIFLRVLSYLSPQELAGVQGVNRYFARMSLDQQVSFEPSLHLLSEPIIQWR